MKTDYIHCIVTTIVSSRKMGEGDCFMWIANETVAESRGRSKGDAIGRHLRVLIGKVYETICRQLWRLSRRQRLSLSYNLGWICINMNQSHLLQLRTSLASMTFHRPLLSRQDLTMTQVPEELNLGPNDENVIQKGQATGIYHGTPWDTMGQPASHVGKKVASLV